MKDKVGFRQKDFQWKVPIKMKKREKERQRLKMIVVRKDRDLHIVFQLKNLKLNQLYTLIMINIVYMQKHVWLTHTTTTTTTTIMKAWMIKTSLSIYLSIDRIGLNSN